MRGAAFEGRSSAFASAGRDEAQHRRPRGAVPGSHRDRVPAPHAALTLRRPPPRGRLDQRLAAAAVAACARGALFERWIASNSSRLRPGADRDAGERALGEVDRHLRLVAQPLVEAGEERAAAGEHDAAVHDVRGELGRRLVERRLDRVDDLRDRLVERAADLLGA